MADASVTPPWMAAVALAAHALLCFALFRGAGALVARAARRALARSAAEPWTERARALYPYRLALPTTALVALFGGAAFFFLRGPLGPPPWLWALFGGLAGHLGATQPHARLEAELLGVPATARTRRAAALFRWLLLFPHVAVVVPFALAAPAAGGLATGAWCAAGIAAMLVAAAGGGFAVARLLGVVRPARAGLERLVRAQAERVGARVGGVDETTFPQPNAFALPFLRRIVFTRTAVERLDPDELAAVARHEAGHLRERGAVRATRLAVPLTLAPLLLVKPAAVRFGPAGVLAILVSIVVLLRVLRLLFRRWEGAADAVAHGADEASGEYARALESLHRMSLVPAVTKGSSHPSLYDRMVAAGAPPAYPRPEPPPGAGSFAQLVPAFLAALATLLLPLLAGFLLSWSQPEWSIVLAGATDRTLGRMAERSARRGDHERAAALYGLAADAAPDRVYWGAYRAVALARAGRMAEGEEALRRAEAAAAEPLVPTGWRAQVAASRREFEALARAAPALSGVRPGRVRSRRLEGAGAR